VKEEEEVVRHEEIEIEIKVINRKEDEKKEEEEERKIEKEIKYPKSIPIRRLS
jgi:hypothetical protein